MPSQTPAFLRPTLHHLLALGMAGLCTLCAAQTQGPSPAQGSPVSTAAPAANGVNAVTQAAVQQGALGCASRINQVTNFLGFGPQAGAVLMMPASQSDQRLVPVVMEVPTDDAVVGASAYVSATFAPVHPNGCSATYDAVMYWPSTCDIVAARQFGSFKKVGSLRTNITLLDGGVATKVFLMPAGSGCVSVKKEVVL